MAKVRQPKQTAYFLPLLKFFTSKLTHHQFSIYMYKVYENFIPLCASSSLIMAKVSQPKQTAYFLSFLKFFTSKLTHHQFSIYMYKVYGNFIPLSFQLKADTIVSIFKPTKLTK